MPAFFIMSIQLDDNGYNGCLNGMKASEMQM